MSFSVTFDRLKVSLMHNLYLHTAFIALCTIILYAKGENNDIILKCQSWNVILAFIFSLEWVCDQQFAFTHTLKCTRFCHVWGDSCVTGNKKARRGWARETDRRKRERRRDKCFFLKTWEPVLTDRIMDSGIFCSLSTCFPRPWRSTTTI